MARQARKRSRTGIYHVMLRGINHQTIFEDEEDNQKFLETLKDYQKTSGYTLYAYCLMGNHIHLLIKEGEEEDIGTSFKRIGVSYVYWYNWKYERRGHMFQDRFKSEVVENDEYFQVVIRYIHQNPLKAGIVKDVGDYRWSSYNEYIGSRDSGAASKLCEIDFALDMLSRNRKQAIELFKKYNNTKNEDQCMDFDQVKRLNDSEAREIIISLAGVSRPADIVSFDKEKRNEILRACKDTNMSIRQLSRLTGVSLGAIRWAFNNSHNNTQIE